MIYETDEEFEALDKKPKRILRLVDEEAEEKNNAEESEEAEEPEKKEKAPRFVMAEEDKAKIEKYLSAHKSERDPVYKRLSAIMKLAEGKSMAVVAKELLVSTSSVNDWQNRYMKKGLNGLTRMKYHRWKK